MVQTYQCGRKCGCVLFGAAIVSIAYLALLYFNSPRRLTRILREEVGRSGDCTLTSPQLDESVILSQADLETVCESLQIAEAHRVPGGMVEASIDKLIVRPSHSDVEYVFCPGTLVIDYGGWTLMCKMKEDDAVFVELLKASPWREMEEEYLERAQ